MYLCKLYDDDVVYSMKRNARRINNSQIVMIRAFLEAMTPEGSLSQPPSKSALIKCDYNNHYDGLMLVSVTELSGTGLVPCGESVTLTIFTDAALFVVSYGRTNYCFQARHLCEM